MSLRCPDLPFLPGLCPNNGIGQTNFHRCQHFAVLENTPMLANKVEQGIEGSCLVRDSRYPSIYSKQVVEIPAWIALDKQVLKFNAFFQETLQEFRCSSFQIRSCIIYFFLEDGTIKIIEPKVENSGISQGTLVSRQRIRLPKPKDDLFFDIIDFNIGKEIMIFGKVFKLTDCDEFTRKFLNRNGISVPDPIEVPKDPYNQERKKMLDILLPKKPNSKIDVFGQFLAYDRKVLCFFGYWDDRATYQGIFHDLEVHYYLADDTIEIKENLCDTQGRKSSTMFLKRSKLPKFSGELLGPGMECTTTVLNVLGPGLQEGRFVIDPLNCGRSIPEYYKQTDLAIGASINCYGRKIVLTDCDTFTKEFYRLKYGVDNFTTLPKPETDTPVQFVSLYKRELPPWNGYGSFEDSAQNCVTVELKPLLKNLKQFLAYDRQGMNSHVLRFVGKLLSKNIEDSRRKFIICYYLADNTISVYESTGTQFMRREQIKLPGQDIFTREPPDYYTPQHMYIGAKVNFYGFLFVLIDADEYSLRFMELHSNEFPKSNATIVLNKVREKLAPVYKDFMALNVENKKTIIPFEELRDKLCNIMGENWTEHEMITLARHFSAVCKTERHSRDYIRSLVLTELKKLLWNDYDRLKEYFLSQDNSKTGYLPKKKVFYLLRGCKLPIDKDLIEEMLNVIEKNEKCELNYQDLFCFLDRNICPVPDALPINIKRQMLWTSETPITPGKLIDWCAFNKSLNLDHLLKNPIQIK